MKKQEIFSEGICGLNVEFSFVDMYAMSQMKKNLQKIENNHKDVDAYNKLPYDQRKDIERPNRLEIDDNTIHQLINLFGKLAIPTTESDLFEDEKKDEPRPHNAPCDTEE